MAQSPELQETAEGITHPESKTPPKQSLTENSAKTTVILKKPQSQSEKVDKSAQDSSYLVEESSVATNIALEPSVALTFNRQQPSKPFLTKCRKEFDGLLEVVDKEYHRELKELYARETHSDLIVVIGEFSKPLHRCVVASRVYKLYRALLAFSIDSVPLDSSLTSDKLTQRLKTPEVSGNNLVKNVEVSQEQINLNCSLPEDLISADLFLSVVRRVYLDQDVSPEEDRIYKTILDWLRINRPELIKITPKNSPDHRSSFRTMNPSSGSSERSPALSPEQPVSNGEDLLCNPNDDEAVPPATSFKDVSLTQSLTRTETFELISRYNNQDTSPSESPSKNLLLDNEDDRAAETSLVNEVTDSQAPTTRTGLKPKAYTTSSEKNSSADSLKSKTRTSKPRAQDCQESSPFSTGLAQTKNVTDKTSVKSSTQPKNLDVQKSKRTPLSNKTNIQSNSGTKTKPTIIARAHPISLERSQSPGTNAMKNSGRNFIAANKRLISQIEKKSQAQHNSQIADQESISIELANMYLVEPLNSDEMAGNLDKFSLASRSQLADAMARLFISGQMSDTILNLKDDKQLKAHLCILAARSAYFAEIINQKLSSKKEGARQVPIEFNLSEYSSNTVSFSMMHIYSGIAKVPDDVDVEELAKLANLLHVTTLNQVCIHNLKMNFCHYFHKPCNVCSLGVLKTLPLAWRYDYSDLYTRCLHWIGNNFATIFCLREFSELKPQDLVEECYNATLSQLTPDNIIPKTIECQKLLKNLPRVKWTESVICLIGRQLEDFCHYVATNYEKILQSESFINLSKNFWECEILEENLLAAMNHLKPEMGCKTLIQLHKIECSIEPMFEAANTSDSFANLIAKMVRYCERYLLKEATSVVHCGSWRHMNPTLQKRIKDQAILATDFDEPSKQLSSKPKLVSSSRTSGHGPNSPVGNSPGDDTPKLSSDRSTPESRLRSPSTTYLPAPKNKAAAARHVKVIK